MKAFLVVLIFIYSGAWASESCSTIDYRSELGPNRDQGEMSWCFAFTSADLISQRVKQRISAADLASTFIVTDPLQLEWTSDPDIKQYLHENSDFYKRVQTHRAESPGSYDPKNILKSGGLTDTGGQEDTTIMLANTKGLCLEKDFPSTEPSQNKFLKNIAKIHAQKNRKHQDQYQCPVFRPQTDFTSSIIDPLSVAIMDVYETEVDKKCQRKPWPVPLIPVMTKFGDNLAEYEAKVKKGEITKDESSKKLFATIDNALENGRIAAIGYSAYTIMRREGDDDKHGDHSSVIAARKMIQGKCQYLIRNTWGDDCSMYYQKFRSRCEKGNVWITKEELKESLYSVTYMK